MTPLKLKSHVCIITADVVSANDTNLYTGDFNKSPNALAGIDVDECVHADFVAQHADLADIVDVEFTVADVDAIIDPLRYERKIRIRYVPTITAKTPESETYLALIL